MGMELDRAVEQPNNSFRSGDPWPEVRPTSRCGSQSEVVKCIDKQISRCNNNIDNVDPNAGLSDVCQNLECSISKDNRYDKVISMTREVSNDGQTMEILSSPGRRNSVLNDIREEMMSASVPTSNDHVYMVDGNESNIFRNSGGADNSDATIYVEADGIRKIASVTKLMEDSQNDSQGRCRDLEVKSDGNANPLQSGDLKLSKSTDFIEKDETAALWVKCRGKWEAGIKCSRADWPLSILNSKPAPGRKKYCVVYFPNRKAHSWVDILLVRPIDESPEPLACGTHRSYLESVKDMNSARQYIMKEIVIQMLNVIDRLHQRAVTENARQASTWKEFAWKGSHCELYCDLGYMLVELQQMLLPGFVDSVWLQDSFIHWVELCKNAETAESIEILKKELVESILWDQVEELWDMPAETDLDNGWESWKQEVIKWFSSPPFQAITEPSLELLNFDDTSASSSLQVSRKRQKLEIRRADTGISEVETETCQADAEDGVLTCVPASNSVLAIEAEKNECIIDDLIDGEGWVEIAVEEEGYSVFSENAADIGPSVSVKASLRNMEGRRKSHTENKYRHCMAFMEAKGRQCGRWANDGEIYCPAHLSSHNAEKARKVEQTPPTYSNLMCEGTTNLGGKCKHRARFGSLYCKKHRPDKYEARKDDTFFLPHNLKRKLSEAKDLVENVSSQVLTTGREISSANCENQMEYHYNAVFEREDIKDLLLSQTVNSEPLVSNDLHGEAGNWSRCISDCSERAKMHNLYCEKHRPNFLKRSRNGKTRLISKEHFVDLLKDCCSQNQKVQIHQACELLYGFMKSALSRKNHVSKDKLMEWIVSEALKDSNVGKYLLKIVTLEREKIGRILGLEVEKGSMDSTPCLKSMPHCPNRDGQPGPFPAAIKCKICAHKFLDDQALGGHWMDVHRKEAQWLFRGYACAMCMTSFTNRKVLETHAKEKHNVHSVDEYVLFQCMPCGENFKNPEQLWVHVLSLHSKDFRHHASPVLVAQTHSTLGNDLLLIEDTHVESKEEAQKFICKFCGLKFDLLPDLGRHHQAAHTVANVTNHFRPNRQVHFISAPRRRPGRPRKYIRDVDSVTQEENNFDLSYFPDSDSMTTSGLRLLTQISEAAVDEKLIESQCSSVAQILSDEIQRTKYHPSNLEILSVAQSTCCKSGLQSALAKKFGPMSDRVYLKAARLCSELNFRIEWHREGFVCPQRCQESRDPNALVALSSLPDLDEVLTLNRVCKLTGDMLGMEESHFTVNFQDLRQKNQSKTMVLCADISFGRERISVPCVVDDHLKSSLELRIESSFMPWKNFTYITDRMLSSSLGMNMKSSQLGCSCHPPTCCPETCDHVYLFNNDCESAKDIYGGTLHERFPYDDMGRLILEEGYLVYECNSMCSCDKTCRNRVLQNGLHVRIEIFLTQNKGWAVRTCERIARGTFVCEFMGEVLNDQETNERGNRHDNAGCCFIYDIDAHIDVTRRMNDGSNPYIIDATHYGNVSRFINHSCSPNLVNYQVLVESMDCQLAHIGLYASRDIDEGEELVYDYRYKLLPGDGFPCYCGASNCRGRLL